MQNEVDTQVLEKPQPVFNVPAVILILIGLMAAIHFVEANILGIENRVWFIYSFSFIPARFSGLVGGEVTQLTFLWTPVSYSLLHADWTHLIVNSVWMLAFGSVVARRFKTLRFLAFCVLGALAGAALHLFSNIGSLIPMVGASAVVSACMGAAMRFAFPEGAGFSPNAWALPAQSLAATLSNTRALTFIAVWFGINLVFGLGGEMVAGEGQSIAWQAHVGGFLAGILGFGLFEKSDGPTGWA